MNRSMSANAFAMLAAKLLPPAFAFAVHVAVARLAGPETLGAYVTLLAVLMIFQAVAGAGLQFLVSREIAAAPAQAVAYARQARAFSLLTGLAGTVLYAGYTLALLPAAQRGPAFVLAATVLPSAWIALQEAIFIGTRTHHWIAVVAIVENTIKAGGAIAALLTGQGLLGVCTAIAVARLGGLLTGTLLVRRTGVVGTWRFDVSGIAPFVREIAPFSVLFVLSMAYFRVDLPIVQAIAGQRSAGFYGTATTLYGALLLIPESALAAAYPRLARAFRTSEAESARAMWVLAKALTIALTALSISLVAASDSIITVVYGAAFASTAPALRLLALALPFHALNGALGQALQAAGRQRLMVAIVVAGVATHVVANVVLVSAFGFAGAAMAMVISSGVVALSTIRALHTSVLPLPVSWRTVPAVLGVAGPLALVFLAPDPYRALAAVPALGWLLAGARWHGTLAGTELARMRHSLEAPPAGAAA